MSLSARPVDYSIIIPAYNEAEELPRTLALIQAQMAGLPWQGELIVVDNNSSDNTAQIARDLGATVVFEPYNQIARARNAGGHHARGRWLIFVDADTRPQPGLLQASLQHMASGKVYGGGCVLEFDRPVDAISRFLAGFWHWTARRLRWAAGGYFFCLQTAFGDTGGFQEAVYAGEEVDFSQMLKRWGKARDMRFAFIEEPRAVTSARKMEWHSTCKLLGMLLLMCCLPWLRRSRRACWFWYRRPLSESAKA